MLPTKAARLLILGAVFSCCATVSPAAQPGSALKGKSASVRLNHCRATALYHSLTKTEVTDKELASLFCQRGSTDEFARRRQVREAKSEYTKCLTAVAGAKIFQVDVFERIGAYSFNAHGFPLLLYQGAYTYVLPDEGLGCASATEANFKEGNLEENKRFDVNRNGVRLWYNILDEMRFLGIDEGTAERIQPHINEVRNWVTMSLFLKPVSAEEQAGPDGSGNVNTGIRLQTISFEVAKFIVRIPAEAPIIRDGIVVRSRNKETVIKTWEPTTGKPKSREDQEAATKKNLGKIRSALGIYYGDNDGIYPVNLAALTVGGKYLARLPSAMIPSHHPDSSAVAFGKESNDAGGWLYNNIAGDANIGTVTVNCTHTDVQGVAWPVR